MWIEYALAVLSDRKQYTVRSYYIIGTEAGCNLLNRTFDRMHDEMANKRTNKKEQSEKVQWLGFSNVPLTADLKRQFQAWVVLQNDYIEQLSGILSAGYKINLAFNAKNDAFSASLTCVDPDDENAGLTMTSLAPDADTAIALAIFKHYVVCERVWPTAENGAGKSQWG